MLKFLVMYLILIGTIFEYILVFKNNMIGKSARCLFEKSLIWACSDRTVGGKVDHPFKMCYFIFKVNDSYLFHCR